MNYDINKVLENLEENLQNVNSAREQVETVLDADSKINKNLELYVQQLADIANQLGSLKSVIKKEIGSVMSDAKTEVSKRIEDILKITSTVEQLVSKTETKINESTTDIRETFQTSCDNISSAFSTQVTSTTSNFKKETKETTDRFAKEADEVTKTAKSVLEEQNSENLKTLNQILETHNNIKQLIGQLLALDIPETLKNINNNLVNTNEDILDLKKELVKIETNNQSRFQITKILQISTLAITGIFGILIVLKLLGVL